MTDEQTFVILYQLRQRLEWVQRCIAVCELTHWRAGLAAERDDSVSCAVSSNSGLG